MADAPTFIHIDKAVAIWLGNDGVPCIIYPNKVPASIAATFAEYGDSGAASTSYTVNLTVGDNILYYIRSQNQSFDVNGAQNVMAVPCFFLTTIGNAATVIANAKYPRVFCTPLSNIIYMTYWANEKEGNLGEPVKSDGTLENGWQRVLYTTVGTPKYMRCTLPSGSINSMFYVFSEPVKILTPDKWDSGGGEEPVLDVTMGGTSYWLADPT